MHFSDSGHGFSEELTEIELRNADNVYISSKDAGSRGGIMSAATNAGIPDSLDGSFADVNLLNQVRNVTASLGLTTQT